MLNSFVFSLPVDRDVIFTDHKGNYKKKIEKQQRNLIVKIPFIKTFLKPGENILCITTGYSQVNNLDQILTAWIFIYLKRSLFVFTNKRIFHVPTTVRYGYRNSIAQILYSENQSVTLKGCTLIVQCGVCGDQDKYIGIRGKDKKKIRTILKIVDLILFGFLVSFYLKLSQDNEAAILYLALFGGMFIFEKIATMYHSSHFIDEFVPEIEEVKPLLTL